MGSDVGVELEHVGERVHIWLVCGVENAAGVDRWRTEARAVADEE